MEFDDPVERISQEVADAMRDKAEAMRNSVEKMIRKTIQFLQQKYHKCVEDWERRKKPREMDPRLRVYIPVNDHANDSVDTTDAERDFSTAASVKRAHPPIRIIGRGSRAYDVERSSIPRP